MQRSEYAASSSRTASAWQVSRERPGASQGGLLIHDRTAVRRYVEGTRPNSRQARIPQAGGCASTAVFLAQSTSLCKGDQSSQCRNANVPQPLMSPCGVVGGRPVASRRVELFQQTARRRPEPLGVTHRPYSPRHFGGIAGTPAASAIGRTRCRSRPKRSERRGEAAICRRGYVTLLPVSSKLASRRNGLGRRRSSLCRGTSGAMPRVSP